MNKPQGEFEPNQEENGSDWKESVEDIISKVVKSNNDEKPPTFIALVHKFDCINGHVFFMPLNLPITLTDMEELLKTLQCPVCKTHELNLFAQMHQVL